MGRIYIIISKNKIGKRKQAKAGLKKV